MKSIGIAFVLAIGYLLTSCNTVEDNPLRVSDINPRYFTDNTGKAVYLTGSHTWNNLVAMIVESDPSVFDYPAYLDFLKKYDHNYQTMGVGTIKLGHSWNAIQISRKLSGQSAAMATFVTRHGN